MVGQTVYIFTNNMNDDWGWFIDLEEELKFKKQPVYLHEDMDAEYEYYMSIYHTSKPSRTYTHTYTHTHCKVRHVQPWYYALLSIIGILICMTYYQMYLLLQKIDT